MTGLEKSEAIIKILEDKKAIDIKRIDLEGLSIIADYLVMATGMNKKHIEQLGFYCEEELEKNRVKKLRREKSQDWLLLDFGDLIVHIFEQKTRAKYNLEDLWSVKI